jgi:hypothetical protein
MEAKKRAWHKAIIIIYGTYHGWYVYVGTAAANSLLAGLAPNTQTRNVSTHISTTGKVSSA